MLVDHELGLSITYSDAQSGFLVAPDSPQNDFFRGWSHIFAHGLNKIVSEQMNFLNFTVLRLIYNLQ